MSGLFDWSSVYFTIGLVASRTTIVEANDKEQVIQARVSLFLSSCRDEVEVMVEGTGRLAVFAQRVSDLQIFSL
jgi:hypothetical protein